MASSKINGLIVLLLVLNAEAVQFGFREIDFTSFEGSVTVVVTKDDANIEPYTLTIAPLTYDQFDSGLFPLPADYPIEDRPDAAELSDFDNTEMSVTFQPSSGNDEMTITISLTDDDINEATEGFFLLATVNALESGDEDVMNSIAIRNGVVQINILDDDALVFSFDDLTFTIPEEDATLSDLVTVSKDIESELTLPVLVATSDITAEIGSDYNFDDTIQLMFSPDDTQLSIPFSTLGDLLVEGSEMFSFTISVPENPVSDYSISPDAANVNINIEDNDVAVIGFEMEEYTFSEGTPNPQVCLRLFEPEDQNMISTGVFFAVTLTTTPDTALAGDDYNSVIVAGLFNPLSTCYDITLIDDDVIENTELFRIGGSIFSNVDFTVLPSETSVFILDDDDPNATTPPPDVETTSLVTDSPETTAAPPPETTQPQMTMGSDPHFSILLPTGQLICFSVQGEHGFTFNLITNDLIQVNALFVPDQLRDEVTWIGAMGVVVKGSSYKTLNDTKLRFVANEKKIYLGNTALDAAGIDRIQLSGGKLTIFENEREDKLVEVDVVLADVGLEFSVRFVKGTHLDMVWKKVVQQSKSSHGLIGQFLRDGVEVDETRRLLQLPNMEPVPVMRKPVWHFMERETPEDQLCWVAMNPGYQGKHLIEGHYLDYLVDDVLSSKFTFK